MLSFQELERSKLELANVNSDLLSECTRYKESLERFTLTVSEGEVSNVEINTRLEAAESEVKLVAEKNQEQESVLVETKTQLDNCRQELKGI